MKNIIKYLCYTLILGVLTTSCDNEDFTEGSKMDFTDAVITVSTSQTSYTFDESLIDEDNPSTFSVKISASLTEPQPLDAIVTFVQTSGNANSDDYTVGEIKIPAGATTGSTNLKVLKTGDIEGAESFNLSAVTDGNFKLSSNFNLSTTINDYVTDVLEFSTTWAGEYSYETASGAMVTLDYCNIDFDVLLYTSAGAFVQYIGGTAACVETGSISGLPDGDYFVVLDLYENPFSAFGVTESVPVTVSYSQEHFISGKFTNNSHTVSSTPGLTAVATITKIGYNYTVTPL